MLAVSYNRTFAGAGDVAGGAQVPLYSISAVVPHTGHLIEVISEHVDKREKGAFRRWPGDSCPKANEVEQSVMEMRRAWHGAGGRMVNVNGFPDLLIVKVAAPANIDKFASFVSATLGDGASRRRPVVAPPPLF